MLAIFLAWPMVFGSDKTSAVRAAGAKVAAVAAPAASARLVQTAVKPAGAPQAKALESCFKRYEREYARCNAIDSSCRMKVADQWDLCEATGFWP
ncbi:MULTISPECIES: hypothetical protein [unclassified Sphingomonas]|uniref:hypothetical protein n=1 Tax=unclassified Sphingomonas TaxID=196159 RepID=UPI002150B212|nr:MULTISPECIES: hypothetical protein [unclassified Sphingomonas]MCR5869424.1 hypothetical protein [Sphingomonas sp. J344]UUX98846.1 hypothetical protein LRS08_15195 [Sphingomonas sp. J315]